MIGLLMVNSRRLFDRVSFLDKLAPVMPIVSALIVLILGFGLTWGAYVRARESLGLAGTSAGGVDAARILYQVEGEDRVKRLFVADVKDGQSTALTDAEKNVVDFSLSSDETQLIYVVQTEELQNEMWLANLTSGESRKIYDCTDAVCSQPVWSPDGARIIFEHISLTGADATGLTTLWWIDTRTNEVKPLFQEGKLPGANPRWSPDGKWLSYATSENVNNAVSWLKTQNQKPFFLWLAFNAPHDPLHLPPAGLHSYTNLSGTQQDIKKNPKEYFKADIQALDHEIGRLFDSLQVLNKLDSTYIIFIGDNGQTPKIAQIADTSRAKGTVYEYGIHIPFFISGPSVVNPGRISDALVNTADIFATVVELFGYADWKTQMSSNKQVDSESILPVLKDQSNDIRPWAFSEIFKPVSDSNDGKAMRNKVYKLIQFNYGKQEFYDLVNDPLETVDLLLSPMSDTQISNYYYLCNEMKNLTGIGINCKVLVGISETDADQFFTYPNPFNSQIQVSEPFKNSQLQLINLLG